MIAGFDEGLPSLFLVVFRVWRSAGRVFFWTCSVRAASLAGSVYGLSLAHRPCPRGYSVAVLKVFR